MATVIFSVLSSFILTSKGTYLDTSSSGKSTYYGGNPGGGACGYATVPTATFPFGYYSACGETTFNLGYGCGACYEITCIGPYSNDNTACSCDADTPSVIVSCMDQCPECATTHFDLDTTAMERIVGDGLAGTCGVIETTVRRVSCDYTGNIKIRAKSGTSEYWYGLHVDDVAEYGTISLVELKSNSASYDTTCDKSSSASFWLCAGGNPLGLSLPLSVRLTNENNEALTCDGCITSFTGGAEFDFGSNFGSSNASITSSPTTTTATMSSSSSITTSAISNTGSGSYYIVIQNHATTQAYYLRFILQYDASSCGDSISWVAILENNVWRNYSDQYTVANEEEYAWDYNGTSFQDMLPISVRIMMSSGTVIDLWGIITDLNADSEFTSSERICGGTPSPTADTSAPSTKQPTSPTTPYPTAEATCIDTANMQWQSYNNQIYLNGNRFNMKGLSWFGFETSNYDLFGLNVHSLDWYLEWMLAHGFNAIRLPFSQDFMDGGTANQNAFKLVVQEAGKKGLLVMPDFHSKSAGVWTEGLNSIDKSTAIQTWQTVATLLIDEYNVFIADAFNEPHDVTNSEWGTWIQFTEDVADAIWSTGVNWMIAVQGTNWECSVINCAWGENLQGVKDTSVTFDLSTFGTNRFVWSPHVYGADVTSNPYSFSGWQAHWGYLVDGTYASNEAASVIGEFGTRYATNDSIQWMDDLITYLIDIDQRNTFFWCLNPNSGDTGGLLEDDWTTEESAKLTALDRLQPNPSTIVYNEALSEVCVTFGNNNDTTITSTTADTTTSTTISATDTTDTSSTDTSTTGTNSATTEPISTTDTITTSSSSSSTSSYSSTSSLSTTSLTVGSSEDYILIKNHVDGHEWYLRFILEYDATECGDSVADVQIFENNEWRSYSQHYTVDNEEHYAWEWNNMGSSTSFQAMLPISVRIETVSGRDIELMNIILDFNTESEFTSNPGICDYAIFTTTEENPTTTKEAVDDNWANIHHFCFSSMAAYGAFVALYMF